MIIGGILMDFKPFDKVLVRDGIDQSWEIEASG